MSGNVSLYNETEGVSIKPTPMLAMVGLVDDVTRAVGCRFLRDGDAVVLLGAPSASAIAAFCAGRDSGRRGWRIPPLT